MPEKYLHPVLQQRIERYFFEQGLENIVIEPLNVRNFLGVVSKVTVKNKNVGRPLKYILKSAPNTEAVRKYAQMDKLFKKEIFAYEKLFQFYSELITEHEVTEPFAQIPRIYWTCNETFQESLLMENMVELGFQQWDLQSSPDLSHIMLVMKTYGKLHALSYALREHRSDSYKKITEYAKEKFSTNNNVEVINNQQKNGCKRALDTLNPSQDRRAIQLFKKFMERPFEYQMQALKMGAMGAYSVITHGDAVLTNMLFKYNDSKRPTIPTDICLLDWQFCRYGSPAFDLSQFIFFFTDKAFRDKHYNQILRAYHYSLCSYLTEFNLNPEEILPYDILLLQMKRFSVFGLCMAVMTLHILTNKPEEVRAWPKDVQMSEINATFDETIKSHDHYKSRMRDIIIDFVKYGYFEFLN